MLLITQSYLLKEKNLFDTAASPNVNHASIEELKQSLAARVSTLGPSSSTQTQDKNKNYRKWSNEVLYLHCTDMRFDMTIINSYFLNILLIVFMSF